MRRLFLGLGVLGALALSALGGCSSGPPAEPAAAAAPVGTAPAWREARPRDAYVLLSGGGTPLTNNYSQYVQARAVAEFFERECPPAQTWVFFGAGNRDGAPPALADARREVRRDGLIVQTWLPGALPRNRPATREVFLRALREEILPTVRGGGTLHLFVGDHGELAGERDRRESAITLWQLKRGRRASGWITDEQEVLGVAELRQALAAGLGAGRVVFCMTQCHSGGFHELGVAREIAAPRAWFTQPPARAAARASALRLPIAGFTATDEESLAAGCDADPDPDQWAGYERFMPESLFGIDLMSGSARPSAARSFADAHELATLVDQTIDKPRATSEHYLAAWADLIETQLAGTLAVTARAQQAVAAYQHAVDRGVIARADDALRQRRDQLARFTQRLAEQVPAAKDLLLHGTRAQLEAAIDGRGERTASGPRRGRMAELRRAWTETLRPAWKAAVRRGAVPELSGAALAFEQHLLELEDRGRDFLLPRGGDDTPLLNELYWTSGYAAPATLDRPRAEAMARWAAERRERIVAWAARSPDAAVRAAGSRIGPGPAVESGSSEGMSRKTAAERVLFYRRVLAAWEFLLAMEAEPALGELRSLIELERTPLRPVPAS